MPRLVAVWVALLVALASFVGAARGSIAQSEGNSYLSGTYGFGIGWDDRIWYVIEQEIDDEWEEVTLSDGTSFLFFNAGAGYGGQAQPCLADVVDSMIDSRGVDQVEQQVDDQGDPIEGGDDERAFAAYSYELELGDGTTVEFARYIECQTMIVGESVIIADLIAPMDEYETELNLARDVIDAVTLPSPGEPAPVFVSEQWRLAVVSAEQGGEIDAAGLEPRDDNEWLVVVVDVTNMQSEPEGLSVRDFTVQIDETDEPIRLAPGSTVSAADELGTGPASANRGVSFEAGQTERLTLVFLLPGDAINPTLLRAGSALPLSSLLEDESELGDLRAEVSPPFMREVRVDEVLPSGWLRATFMSDGEDEILELVGVEPLTADDCHGPAYLDALRTLIGKTIQFEREVKQPLSDPISGYVWTTDEDGLPVQFNQQLLIQGDAARSDDVDDARFGAWLTASSQEAEQAERGLWGECE